LRQRVLRLRPPQAHQPGELLATGQCSLLGACQLRGGVGQQCLFARLLQLAPVSHAGHAAGQLGAGFCRLLHVAHVLRGLAGSHGANPGLAGVGGSAYHVLRGLQAGQLALLARPPGTPGQRQQAQHVELQEAFNFHLAAFGETADGKVRVRHAAGLYAVCVADVQRRQRGLQ